MSGHRRTITGPYRADPNVTGTANGTGYRIGDNFTLTAGHVVFEWDRSRTNPQIITGGNTIELDYRGYGATYLAQVQALIASAPGTYPTNRAIENDNTLVQRDSVVIRGGGNVGANHDGLVVFLAPQDMRSTDLPNALTNASIWRDANTTGLVTGNITFAGGGQLHFSTPTQGGDSGGAYLLRFDARDFVLGTNAADAGGTFALGTYFSYANWTAINAHMAPRSGNGDMTDSDPTNMVVGRGIADPAVVGSYRADILLGRGGDDVIEDGDSIGGVRWARDRLYGGAGNDVLRANDGRDLLHGGDHGGSTNPVGLEADGIDRADYAAYTSGITVKVTTVAPDTTYTNPTNTRDASARVDATQAVWVKEPGTAQVHDTLVSIERIVATAADDVVQVDALRASFLAGADGTGGLAEVDLGANPAGRDNGDLVGASNMTEGVKIDLSAGRVELRSDPTIGFSILNAERIHGGDGDDELIGNDAENVILGNEGDDRIRGGAGNDKLEGDDGKDEIDGEAGNDEIKGGAGDDTLKGGADNDTVEGEADNDTLIGGAGTDTLKGGDGNDTLDGETDDSAGDSLDGGAGNDIFKTNNGDTVVDVEGGDSITLAGKALSGGERKLPPSNPCAPPPPPDPNQQDESGTYTAADGTVYSYDKTAGTLTVTAGGASVTINGFVNGEAGISLRETRPNQQQAECQRDPLIIDLNGDRSVVDELFDSQAYFDLDNDGFAEHVAWALPEDGLLALDRDGDGRITSGAELFGTGRTTAFGGRRALDGSDGFTELARLDSNHDGAITAADTQFAELRLWQDADGDAITDAGELKTLAELGIVSISLAKTASNDLDCGCDGTDVVSMSRVERADGSVLRAYDAYLSIDQYDSRERTPVAVSEAAAALPQLLGSGSLSNLHVAMSRDPALLEMVQELAALTPDRAGEIFGRVEQILLRWTGADQVAIDSRGPNINGRWVSAIEAITGSSFVQASVGANPRQDGASILAGEWQEWVTETAAKLLGQIDLGDALTPGLSFAAGAFFVADGDASLDEVLAAIGSHSPDGLAEAAGYWHAMLGTLSRYAGELGVTLAQIDAAAASHLAASGLPFTLAQLRAAVVGGDASGALTGIAPGFGFSGHDLLVLLPGVERANGGTGDDTYVLGAEPGNVRIRDDFGNDDVLVIDADPADITILFTPAPQGALISVVSDAGIHATFDMNISDGQFYTSIEKIQFADGTLRYVTDGNTLVNPDGGRIVFASRSADTEITGGSGSDLLVGFERNDTYRVGPDGGNDTVREKGGIASPNDRLLVDAPLADVTFSVRDGSAGADVVMRFVSTGAEVVLLNQRIGASPIERVEFSDGATLTLAELDTILNTGTDAGETILGSVRDDVIDGRGGDDLLRGGDGRDHYLFGPDSGSDRIQDSDLGNRVILADGIVRADLEFERGGEKGFDLVVRLAGTDSVLVIENGLRQPYVTEFRFDDGTTLGIAEVILGFTEGNPNEISGTDRNDQLNGTEADERLSGGEGNDRLDGGEGNDFYLFGPGDDSIYDNGFSIDTLLAPAGATLADLRIGEESGQVVVTFRGHSGSVVLANRFHSDSGYGESSFSSGFAEAGYGDVELVAFGNGSSLLLSVDNLAGTAGDDLLFDLSFSNRTFTPLSGDDLILAGPGHSTILLDPGFGDLVVADLGGFGDTIAFSDEEVTIDRLSFERDGFDLIIRVAGEDGSVRIENQLLPNQFFFGNRSFEQISLADGTGLSAEDIVARLTTRTDGDDWIGEGSRDGGAGDDVLVGGSEANEYVFAAGYGDDVVKDFGEDPDEIFPWTELDVVTLAGLYREDVAFSRAPDDPHSILVTIVATGETLRIDRTPYDGDPAEAGRRDYMVERFDFADGTSLSGTELRQQLLDAGSTSGDDEIEGLGLGTIVDGGAGNDLIGISGGGAVVLAAGGGQDVVWFSGESRPVDIVVRGAEPGDVIVRPVSEAAGVTGDHVRFELPDGSSVTILHVRRPGGGGGSDFVAQAQPSAIGNLIFDDGDPISYDGQLAGLVFGATIGTAANDGLVGARDEFFNPVDDLFDSGAGDDVIFHNGGNDRILFGRGSGNDVALADPMPDWKTAGTYTVAIAPGIAREDVTLALGDDGRTLVIGFVDAPDTISIDRKAAAGVEFADGRILSFVDPDQSFYEYQGATVEGGAGDDTIVAAYGGVELRFGPGDGVDHFSDELFDSLIGGDATGTFWVRNVISFREVEGPADLLFARDGDSADLVIIIRATGDRVTIGNQFAGSGTTEDPTRLEAVVTEFVFDDGTSLSWAVAQALVEDLDPGTIPLPDSPVTYFDLAGLQGEPTAEADTLYLAAGEETDSQGGADRIVAIGQGVTLVWGSGDGDDLFIANADSGGENRLRFDDVDGPAGLQLLRGGDNLLDLLIVNRATGETLTIRNQFVDPAARQRDPDNLPILPVAVFEFADGTTRSWTEMFRRVDGADDSGDDTVSGDDGGSTLDGGAGSDSLVGGEGDDVFLFGRDYDEDRIEDSGGNDVVRFGEGVTLADVFFSRTADDGLLIEVIGLDRLALLVEGQFGDESRRIETFMFANGDRIGWDQVEQFILRNAATTGADAILGFASADYITGDDGNDSLQGAGGDDRIDGGEGRDAALFTGRQSEYAITHQADGTILVTDLVAGRDGADLLSGIEDLVFLGEPPETGTVPLAPANRAPTVQALTVDGIEDQALSISLSVLLALASDADGDPVTLTGILEVVGGEAWLGLDNRIRFEPDPDFHGQATIRYQVADPNGGFAVGTIEVAVAAVNDAPVAAIDPTQSAAAVEDEAPTQVAAILATDVDGDSLSYAIVDGDPAGLFAVGADGRIATTRPAADADVGTHALTVEVADGHGGSVRLTVPVAVTGINDVPDAADTDFSAVEDGAPIAGTLTALDADAATLSFTLDAPADGLLLASDGSWTFDPSDGVFQSLAEGEARIIEAAYSATDEQGAAGAGTLTITVTGTNDAPEAGIDHDAVRTLVEDEAPAGIVSVVAHDVDGDSLNFAIVTGNAGGLFAIDAAGLISNTRAAGDGDVGVHLLQVAVSDGHGGSTLVDVAVTVNGINDVPVAQPGSAATNEDAALLTGALVALDPDLGEVLSFALETPVEGLAVGANGHWTFDPAHAAYQGLKAGQQQVIVAGYRVTDAAGATSTSTLTLTLTGTNDVPVVAVPLADRQGQAGIALSFAVPAGSFTDVDGDTLALSATLANGSALPSWLTFNAATGTFSGTAPANAAGSLDVRVRASDGLASAFDDFTLTIDPGSGGGGSTTGFTFHSLNSWHNPHWGGGYIVTYRYVVQPDAIVDGQLKLWDIVANYDGTGEVRQGWVSSFGGPTRQTLIDHGDEGIIFSTVGTSYQPDFRVGDTIYLSIRVDDASFEADDFDFTIFDRDPALNRADAGDADIDALPTIDWGSGLLQAVRVENVSSQRIDEWRMVLDVPTGVQLNVTSVWGATATRLPTGDILFEGLSWNDVIAAGGSSSFGFIASHTGALTISDSSFAFI